ncbi:thioredoxin-disulfide reductase [Ferrimicrobium acidiphilum]|uniref:thioredoxin-disulfide reductase n=1 Tax=Ferrimicrobium acidiphilum TaxID=121039 RepID=UPI0023F3C84A|nr:thioredoxin-disulfide reductase [Ferrimicrobium acidiphilum]
MTEHVRVVIIGSGPAGLTSAIYAARADLQPVVLEGEPSSTSDQPGGQLMLTTEIENFPGFVDGILGPELMANFRGQAERFGARIHAAKASRVDLTGQHPMIWASDASEEEPTYTADAVIVATGARSLMLGVPDELRLVGHGVSTCATCDGFFFRGHRIAVVGGGDSALEEALFLTKFAESVTIIHRRDRLRASKIMQDRALANPKISFLWNRQVAELHEEGGSLVGVTTHDLESGSDERHAFTGLFVAIGHAPNTDIFKGQLEMDDLGYIITQPGSTATSVSSVFAAGDVQDHIYRQAITAAGSGCQAALDVEHYLAAHEA